METYFIRHTEELDIDPKAKASLWESETIAIHFPHYKSRKSLSGRDNSSLDPTDYRPSDAKAIRALTRLAKDGGYVCAVHAGHSECLLGYVPPGTKVDLMSTTWGDMCGYKGRKAILKTITLQKTRIMDRSDLASVLVGCPRQGTIMRWPKAKDVIQNAVEGIHIKPSLDRLIPGQQEILCSEFLRLPQFERIGEVPSSRLAHLLLPTGRTMKDVDICGITESGQTLFAQVTFRTLEDPKAKEKLETLATYSGSGRNVLVFFCDCPGIKQVGEVKIIPLQHAYECFVSTALGGTWLNKAVSPLF
jgi:hypothetical protein